MLLETFAGIFVLYAGLAGMWVLLTAPVWLYLRHRKRLRDRDDLDKRRHERAGPAGAGID